MAMAIIENEHIPEDQIRNLEKLLNEAEDLAILTGGGFMVGTPDPSRLMMLFAFHYEVNDLFRKCCDIAVELYKKTHEEEGEEKEFSVDITNAIEKIVRPHIEKLVGERDEAEAELQHRTDDWHSACAELKKEAIRAERAEAEVARLREEMGKCVHMAKNAGYGSARTMADALLKALAEGNDNE